MSYDDLYYFPFRTALFKFSWRLWIAFSESPWLHSALLLPASVWLLPQLLEHCRIPQLLPKHQTLAACPGAGEWINPIGLPENSSSSFMSKFWNILLYFYNKYRYSYTAVINFIECERSFLSWFRNMNRYFSFYTSIRWIYMNPCHLYFHLYMYLHKWTHSPVINDLYIYIYKALWFDYLGFRHVCLAWSTWWKWTLSGWCFSVCWALSSSSPSR